MTTDTTQMPADHKLADATHFAPFKAYGICLRALSPADLELLRSWRNRADIAAQMLDQRHISQSAQQDWYARIRQRAFERHFVITYKEQPVGSCNLKQADGLPVLHAAELESGFYLADARFRGSMLAFLPALALNQYCFEVLGCTRLLAHVKPDNLAALRFNMQLGYQTVAPVEVQSPNGPLLLLQMVLTASAAEHAAGRFARFARMG